MASWLDEVAQADILPATLQTLKAHIEIRHAAKGTVLLKKGDRGDKSYFVKSGCLRSYAIDDKGKEHVFMFAPEGWLISDIEMHINGTPAQFYIDAIEASELEVIDNHFFSMMPPNRPLVEKLTRRVSVLQKRIIMLMSASLQDRYVDFINTYPDIVQRVPQKMIASYLGVTPEALSKIRGKLARHA